jgi:hypothetical protein
MITLNTHVRDDNWYSDTYNTYDRKYYRFSGYDLGHLHQILHLMTR